MSSSKWRPSCLDFSVFNTVSDDDDGNAHDYHDYDEDHYHRHDDVKRCYGHSYLQMHFLQLKHL